MYPVGRIELREHEEVAINLLRKMEAENPGFFDFIRAGLGHPVVPKSMDFNWPRLAEKFVRPVFSLLRGTEMSHECREWFLAQKLLPPGAEEERQEFMALFLESREHDEEITDERKEEIRQRMLQMKEQSERNLQRGLLRLKQLQEEQENG